MFSKRFRKSRCKQKPVLSFEKFEDRKMLAAITFNSGTGALVVRGDATDDTIALTGGADYQSFTVSINSDPAFTEMFSYADITKLTVFAGSGNDTVTNTLLIDTDIRGENGNDRLEGGFRNDRLYGGNGVDTLIGKNGDDYASGQRGNDWIYGGPGVDNLNGGTEDDNIFGGTGDDRLVGSAGNDKLRGEDGLDRLTGGNGDDFLDGGADRDIIAGSAGNDTLLGQGGNDYLAGNDGNDKIYGQDGSDTLRGDAGDDLLDAGFDQVQDRLTGGTGLDEFVVLGNIGSGSVDVVNDRAGFETYNGYSGQLTALVEVDGDTLNVRGMPGADKIHIYARDGQDKFELRSEHQIVGTYSTSTISEIVINTGGGNDLIDNNNRSIIPMRVDGGAGNDIIRGGRGNDILVGGDGNDSITGQLGDDELSGGSGIDRLYGHAGDDVLNGDEGNDYLYGYDGDDTLLGGAGNDRLYGHNHNDTLRGGTGDDYLHGGNNDDQLFGDAGRDELFGAAHNDSLFGGTDIVEDVLWGNGGTDSFDFVDGIDDVRDRHNSETSTAAVAQSADELSSLTAEVTGGTFSRASLTNFASSGSDTVSDGLNVVTVGARRFVFAPVAAGFQMLGDFSSDLPVNTASAVASARTSAINGSMGASLGPNATVSLVPSFALRSETAPALAGFDSAFVASGNGTNAVIGGASLGQGGQAVSTMFDASDILTDLATRTLHDLADQRLGTSQDSTGVDALAALQSESKPGLEIAIKGLVKTSFVSTNAAVAVRNEIVLVNGQGAIEPPFNLDGQGLEDVLRVIQQRIDGGANYQAGFITIDGETAFFGPEGIERTLAQFDTTLLNKIEQGNAARNSDVGFLFSSSSQGVSAEEKQIIFQLGLLTVDIAGIGDPTPTCDAIACVAEVGQGNFVYAGINLVSMFPYVGDLAKVGKLGKLGRFVDVINNAVELAAKNADFGKRIAPLLEKISTTIDGVVDSLPASAQEQVRELGAKIEKLLTDQTGINPRQRIPRTNGDWDGVPGEGLWRSANPEVLEVTGGTPIRFFNGRPDFSPWSQADLTFLPGTLKGDSSDFAKVYQKLATDNNLPSAAAAEQLFRVQMGLTPHHVSGTLIQMVPTKLHGNITHIGSASDLRNGVGIGGGF